MPGTLFGVAADPATETLTLVGLLLLGIAFVPYGIIGYRKREIEIKGIEMEGVSAQLWGMLLVVIGLVSVGYSLAALLRRGG